MGSWSAVADRLLEPVFYFTQSGQRIYWFYLVCALLLAVLVYARTRDRTQPYTLRACFAFLFPRSVYGHVGTTTDTLYFFFNRVLFVSVFAPLVVGSVAVAAATTGGVQALVGDVSRYVEPGWPLNLALTLCVVLATDFGVFFAHWVFHRLPLLWEFHKTHHSAEVMTPLTVYRQHPLDDLLTMSCAGACGGVAQGLFNACVQTDSSLLVAYHLNVFVLGFYVLGYNLRHSHVWLHFGPALSWLLISPAQHQIHHSRDPKHFDKNMGLMFSFWDRAFGTLYVPREREELEFGLGDGTEPDYRSVSGLYLVPIRNSLRMIAAAATGGPMRKILSVCLVLAMLGALGYDAFLRPPPTYVPSVKLEELTWTEVQLLVEKGSTTALVPTGGTEQNGPHMVLGKHNYVVGHTAVEIAQRLGNVLVAPTLAYVPEGETDPPSDHMRFPGTLSVPESVFAATLEATARSLKAHGFTLICFVGDSLGNQAAQLQVAQALNAEWAESGVRVLHVSDYYDANGQREWLTEQGEDPESIGGHAGIRDTSEVLVVYPQGVRRKRLLEHGGSPGSGVHGDPRRASVQRGRKMLELKIEAALTQIRAARDGGS